MTQRPVARMILLSSTAVRSVLYSHTSYRVPSSRTFKTTSNLAGSSFFDLTRLSASRESQHLSKEKGRPRTDFAPHLELIKSSEVAPFATRSDAELKIEDKDARKDRNEQDLVEEKPEPVQEATARARWEQRTFRYLIKEALEVVKKDKPGHNPARDPLFSISASRTIAKALSNTKEHISPEEMDKLAPEFPHVAHMEAKVAGAKAALKQAHETEHLLTSDAEITLDEAQKAKPLSTAVPIVGGQAGGEKNINSMATMERSIASLTRELQATKRILAGNSSSSRVAKTPMTSKGLLLILLILTGGTVWGFNNFATTPGRHVTEDEWIRMRRSVDSLLNAEFQRNEDEYFEKPPTSRLKKWLWA
ncbi:MAG: hypothetical protein Q9209_002214 [Squamulea sp. 1 TL-2023]